MVAVPSVSRRRERTVAITINRSERDAIYQEVLTDLTGVGDIDIALRNDDYETARRYRRRFEDDMRLLDDLGWEPDQDRDEFELTMPPDGLARVLERLNAAQPYRRAQRATRDRGACPTSPNRVWKCPGAARVAAGDRAVFPTASRLSRPSPSF